MEFKQLRAFVALADTLSFSRAAQSLFISQSALSRQIADLEKEIGVQLFTRNTRTVELTPGGEVLLDDAKEILDRQTKMMVEVLYRVDQKHRAGALSIGTDFRALRAPKFRKKATDIISSLRETFPGIRITVHTMVYKDILIELREKRMDCAFILDRDLVLPPDIDSFDLGWESTLLAFRAKHPRSEDELESIIRERGLLLVEDDHQALYQFLHILDELQLKPQINFCKTLSDVILTVLVGESATILPQSYVETENNPALQTIPFKTESAIMKLKLIWRKDTENPMVEQITQEILSKQEPGAISLDSGM